MNPRVVSFILQFVLIAAGLAVDAMAQDATPSRRQETEVVLLKLYPPIYPPLASQARISGEVKVQVGIRQDGSVASADLISGHPMLKQSALESAEKSTFECRGCGEAVTSYSLTYTFGFDENGPGDGCLFTTRNRSAKCLYLWKCGERAEYTKAQPPKLSQAEGHITLLASLSCIQTISSEDRH